MGDVSAGVGSSLPVSDAFVNWVADTVLKELRVGRVPEHVTPLDFAWDPLLATISAHVNAEDIELARRLVGDHGTLMWGALLARRFPDDVALTASLIDAFDREADGERRVGLFHHLSARSLDPPLVAHLMTWIDANAALFIDDQRRAFGDPTGSERLTARIRSDAPRYRNKRWVYMYSTLALPSDVARSVLLQHLNGDDVVVAKAAGNALRLLSAESPID